MKTAEQIEKALRRVIAGGTQYPGMSYEEGIEEALRWVLGEVEDDEFVYGGD